MTMTEKCHVICVCCGQGFPNGMAQVSRIRMIGKALLAEGCRFTVLNIGAGPCPNSASRGTVDGIEFAYCPGPTTRPERAWRRKWMYLRGVFHVSVRLFLLRRRERNLCVHLYVEEGQFHGFTRFLRAIGMPIIQEVNEWWPDSGRPGTRNWAVKMTQGSLAISRPIIERLKQLPAYTDEHRLLHLPILIDPDEWAVDVRSAEAPCTVPGELPYVLWCGNIDCSDQDVGFLLRVVKAVNDFETCRLVLVGRYRHSTGARIHALADALGLEERLVTFSGFVSDETFGCLMDKASALLLPLWDTERSICRFPTKLGHYLASGTPVVGTALGDLTRYLRQGESACLVPAGDVTAFAQAIIALRRNRQWARAIGASGRRVAIRHFSLDANRNRLAEFFVRTAN